MSSLLELLDAAAQIALRFEQPVNVIAESGQARVDADDPHGQNVEVLTNGAHVIYEVTHLAPEIDHFSPEVDQRSAEPAQVYVVRKLVSHRQAIWRELAETQLLSRANFLSFEAI
jgi:hypothetical protein